MFFLGMSEDNVGSVLVLVKLLNVCVRHMALIISWLGYVSRNRSNE